MSMGIEDIQRMRTAKHYLVKDLSKLSSESIAEQVDAFLKRGGKINRVPQGVTGDQAFERYAITMSRAQKSSERTKRAAKIFGITEAARCISVSHGWLNGVCDRGEGPPFTKDNRGRKEFLRDEVLAWNRQRLEDEIQTQKV